MGNQQNSCTLTQKEIDVIRKTSGKTEDEIRQWFNEFCLESNNTGRMNKRQFHIYYAKLKKNPNLDKMTDHIFHAFDMDHSGTIDFQEFLIAYIATTAGTKQQKFEYSFDVYDIDDNQLIEKKEAKKILSILCRILGLSEDDAKSYTDTLMLTFDTNSDKVLTRSEFINGCLHDATLGHISNPFSI
ncbi:unnamed protein product [Rotaria sp. Silwood2]|nr:unnamed protein product [Rotaria sp. Silwood2]CAF2601087.1 unnamed protein product [Rotaria sp. Silwood2]CAF2827283.1 unnamed protein product [Rotaria sp. Silwood2]CAF2972018.1 unnamed protein product [Rotaria sp. Silwood2]CAF3913113.1 unnamed protein product [Rotaria sp. Silwood2]